MPDIVHLFPVKAPLQEVFRAISTPTGLDAWWTKRSSGEPIAGAVYELWFGPDYDWRAAVSRCVPETEFQLEMTRAHEDWQGTRVTFLLKERDGGTQVRFQHSGWKAENDHYQTSCYCWAMYLRLLKRHAENGEVVPYEDRLDA